MIKIKGFISRAKISTVHFQELKAGQPKKGKKKAGSLFLLPCILAFRGGPVVD